MINQYNQFKQSKKDVELGKFISLVLRHKPQTIGIKLDQNGWADVDELINGMCKIGKFINIEILKRIVAENNKNRYSFNTDYSKIRANQGHSVNVDVELKPANPPKILYHGTAERFIESIKSSGILKQNRQYVHLSSDIETAKTVGERYGKAVVLPINAQKMAEDGYIFYLSVNGVWLCDDIPWKYILADEIK